MRGRDWLTVVCRSLLKWKSGQLHNYVLAMSFSTQRGSAPGPICRQPPHLSVAADPATVVACAAADKATLATHGPYGPAVCAPAVAAAAAAATAAATATAATTAATTAAVAAGAAGAATALPGPTAVHLCGVPCALCHRP